MFKYFVLAIGVLAAIGGLTYGTLATTARTATAAAATELAHVSDLSAGDVPHKGEQFTVLVQEPNKVAAIDPASGHNEPDGSVSIKFLFLNRHEDGSITSSSGRIAFKCKSNQWRVQSFFDLDKDGNPIPKLGVSDEYEQVPEGSVVQQAEQFACNTDHPTASLTL